MTKVAIIEDHPLYQKGLIQAIEDSSVIDLVSVADSIEDFGTQTEQSPDVVILDLHLPGVSGNRAVHSVVGTGAAVLVVSAAGAQNDVLDAIAAGASGYLTKDSDGAEIITAVQIVAEGGTYVSQTLASFLLHSTKNDPPSAPFALRDREKEVLGLVAQGETDCDIAETLFISVRTVRSHLDRIRDKTGRRRRADLTRLAMERGITPLGDVSNAT